MTRSTRDILFIFIGLFASIGTLWASRAATELRLGRDVAYLNAVGRTQEGEISLSQSLETRYGTDAARIAELRKIRLGYGDMSVVFALASRLRGGITRPNIDRLIALWKNHHSGGWGKIAAGLGVRLDRVVLQVESLRAGPSRASQLAAHESAQAAAGPSPVSKKDRIKKPAGYDPVLRLVHGG